MRHATADVGLGMCCPAHCLLRTRWLLNTTWMRLILSGCMLACTPAARANRPASTFSHGMVAGRSCQPDGHESMRASNTGGMHTVVMYVHQGADHSVLCLVTLSRSSGAQVERQGKK
jgi:hypothetical protein